MAGSNGSSGVASQPSKPEASFIIIKFKKLPRRQLTLLAITICLNVLLWSSLFTFITTIYLISADPGDSTNIPSEVLTLASSLVSIGYILLHTIFSLKQRIWKHQRRHPSIIKKTSYFAIRLAVTLCILWLLTSGWNLITVARRPVCLPGGRSLPGWEAGTACVVGRTGMAFSMIALVASCALFGMLAVVRRPFEAHVLKHGYRPPKKHQRTPAMSRRPSPTRSASFISDKFRSRVSVSTHRSTPSNNSNVDVDTLDLASNSPPSTIHAPSPIRAIETPPIFYPSASYNHLPPPPRMSSLIAPSGFVPLSVPAQYSASAWRAVHPNMPSPLVSAATRSHPHLPHTQQGHNFSYRNRYSRSSVSLTRPHRLSSATPSGSVAWSSRSGSTGPDEGRGSPASGTTSTHDRATANAIAYAILNGTPVPGTRSKKHHRSNHVRRASAPDATPDAQYGRKAKGWKPRLQGQEETIEGQPSKIIRSSSADLLSKFSPDSSPDGTEVSIGKELERELDLRLSFSGGLPFRKTRSASPLRHSDMPTGAANVGRSTTVVSRLPQDPVILKAGENMTAGKPEKRRMTFDELKNKPLPKIAAL
ncbi:uncharacterized protein BDR25DRAFT_233152 [Lindgomyces ingoldianus]|uniref:Uncharacterized protein n=1 Tax=Lindgomyces ingoldianus TaxID=673940 RepID=A0ACB6QLS8_9PLEO|nr:uncharacterized protein BDR25DRAFT_233152 [Lindgomyces ingoldianus]KAF2467866.1 hypothetical protein BDR25DRAFT_233152 [Lindgomyces ingoldianus]